MSYKFIYLWKASGIVLILNRLIYREKTLYENPSLLQLVVNLTSPEYGEYIRSRINDNTTYNYTHYDPDFDITIDGGTAHLSVLASDGAAVAMTMTINLL